MKKLFMCMALGLMAFAFASCDKEEDEKEIKYENYPNGDYSVRE